MRSATVGLAALFAVAFAGDGLSQSLGDEIQEDEAPGTEIEAEIGGGEAIIGRERNMPPGPGIVAPPVRAVPRSPVIIEGQAPANLPDDPDEPVSADAIDSEMPGEGPENLSGPDDDDPLPE